MARDLSRLTPAQRVERSIQKKYRDELWGPFIAGIKEYQLIQPGDRVCVCISGGKDSMLLAKLMQMLQKRSDFPFEVKYLVMDPGYTPENRQKILDNAALLDIPVEVRESEIFASVEGVEKNPCYLCARMRRGYLYKYAGELGCNKIALGHHKDDIVETLLMNLIFQGSFGTIPPLLQMQKMPIQMIRPLCLIEEKDITQYAELSGYQKQTKLCPLEKVSSRAEVKQLLSQLEALNPNVRDSIWSAMENIKSDDLPRKAQR